MEKYTHILQIAVTEIKTARINIARRINTASSSVYWSRDKLLNEKKIEKGHGAGVVNRLSVGLESAFPDMGLSSRNPWNMKRFYDRYYLADSKLQRSVAVLPRGHNLDAFDVLTPTQDIFISDNIWAPLKDLGK